MEFSDDEKKEALELLQTISSKIEETRNNIERLCHSTGTVCVDLLNKIPECKGYSFTLSSVTKQNPEPKDGLNQKRIKNLLFPPEQE